MSKRQIRNSTAEFLIFTAQSGEGGIEVRYGDETINEHLKNIYQQGELGREATIRKFRMVQTEGVREVSRQIDFYNLDAIISVGFLVPMLLRGNACGKQNRGASPAWATMGEWVTGGVSEW